mmetsp:Transcript_147/g.271  ORF Transcript_147/g.271 Transcript_147/m.271 type:complete len:83 (-) Transcript_147:523-771(-)
MESQAIEELQKEVEFWKNKYFEEVAKSQHNSGPSAFSREEVKNRLRLACSQNNKKLLQEAVNQAEALGMPEVNYAKRKLQTL